MPQAYLAASGSPKITLARWTIMSRLWSQTTILVSAWVLALMVGPRWFLRKSRSSSAVNSIDSQVCLAIGSFCRLIANTGMPSAW